MPGKRFPDQPLLKDLSPDHARLCLALERFCHQEIGLDLSGRSLILGVSGGTDSVALTAILSALSRKLDLRLIVAHLDHGLRPTSEEDGRFVARMALSWGFAFHGERVDVAELARERGQGVEEAGREARLAFLEHVRAERGADLICLGHTLNDLAEDQLMRLTRGVAWPGLGGMRAHDPARKLLRPLLLTPKAELATFLADLDIPHIEDETNTDPTYTRNRVRARLLPQFLDENPNYLAAVAELWRTARLDEAHFASALAELPDVAPDGTLPRAALLPLSPALRLRAYKHGLDGLGPGQVLAASLRALDEAVMGEHFPKEFQFPGHKTVLVRGEALTFSRHAPDCGCRH